MNKVEKLRQYAAQLEEIKDYVESHAGALNRDGVSEFTVSDQTDKLARTRGVVLIQAISCWVAYECFSGRIVRSGDLIWVEQQLAKLGAVINKRVSLVEVLGEQNEPS